MGLVPVALARHVRDELGLVRAVETGTYMGEGTRLLASVFPEVVTVEVSSRLAAAAVRSLMNDTIGVARVRLVVGSSRDELPALVDRDTPTFWWLDGHWSGGDTEGRDDQCPVLAEVAALAAGHPDDCVVIDDARLFLDPALVMAVGFDADQWPSITEVAEALREARPGSRVTLLDDQVVCVPSRVTAEAGSLL